MEFRYGKENVIATDINNPTKPIRGKFQVLDITRMDKLVHMQNLHRFTDLIHLGAILSAVGESNPILCRDVNVRGFENIIDLAHIWGLRVFSPSSMAVFGDGIPKENVQEDVVLLPNTVYGVTKVYNELLGRYYNKKFDMDIRAMRYPGIISNEEYEYNGTTDYSTEIFWKAIRGEKYTCYLLPDTALPMMHIDDCIRASVNYASHQSLFSSCISMLQKMYLPEISIIWVALVLVQESFMKKLNCKSIYIYIYI